MHVYHQTSCQSRLGRGCRAQFACFWHRPRASSSCCIGGCWWRSFCSLCPVGVACLGATAWKSTGPIQLPHVPVELSSVHHAPASPVWARSIACSGFFVDMGVPVRGVCHGMLWHDVRAWRPDPRTHNHSGLAWSTGVAARSSTCNLSIKDSEWHIEHTRQLFTVTTTIIINSAQSSKCSDSTCRQGLADWVIGGERPLELILSLGTKQDKALHSMS